METPSPCKGSWAPPTLPAPSQSCPVQLLDGTDLSLNEQTAWKRYSGLNHTNSTAQRPPRGQVTFPGPWATPGNPCVPLGTLTAHATASNSTTRTLQHSTLQQAETLHPTPCCKTHRSHQERDTHSPEQPLLGDTGRGDCQPSTAPGCRAQPSTAATAEPGSSCSPDKDSEGLQGLNGCKAAPRQLILYTFGCTRSRLGEEKKHQNGKKESHSRADLPFTCSNHSVCREDLCQICRAIVLPEGKRPEFHPSLGSQYNDNSAW